MMEQKINEENIENNLVFCIDPRKTIAIKSISKSVFRSPSHKNKIYVYFPFRLNFDFGFFTKRWRNRPCIWTISQERVNLDCNFWGSLPFKLTAVGEVRRHDFVDGMRCKFIVVIYIVGNRFTSFGKPRVMGAIESLNCNWWKNMHQMDA